MIGAMIGATFGTIMLWVFRIVLLLAALCAVAALFEEIGAVKAIGVAAIPFAILILTFCITFIPSNNVGIKWSAMNGTSEKTLNEGITFKSPIDKIYLIPTTVQEKTVEGLTVQTKDSQFVTAVVNVKFKVDKKNAFKVYKGYGTLNALKENIISNYAQKAIESAVTKYNVIDVLGEKKINIYSEVTKELEAMLIEEGVSLVQITIKDMDAGEDIEKAIAAEAVAKKEVETAEQKRLKAEKDAETKIINATAEAEANEILTEQLTDAILIDKWISKWDGKLSAVSSDGNMMFDVTNLTGNKE